MNYMARPHKHAVVPARPAMSPNLTRLSQPTEPDSPATEAVQILRKLADGIDPITNTPLPGESPYQSAKVLRALQFALNSVTGTVMKKPRPGPTAAGKPWTDEEDARLVAGFKSGVSVTDLIRKHARTRGAIIARLERHGLAAPSGFWKPQRHPEFQAKRQLESPQENPNGKN